MVRCLQADVLVCAKSGGLLQERMRLVADLWAAGIRAEMMMTAAPSLTDQYEHANGRHIPWLVIMEASKLSASDTVKVSRTGHCTVPLEGSFQFCNTTKGSTWAKLAQTGQQCCSLSL